jgi:catalase
MLVLKIMAAPVPCKNLHRSSSINILENAQWYMGSSKNGIGLAAKAGHNGEPHNHNDVGSFHIFKNGKMTLADIGCGEYDRDYYTQPGKLWRLMSAEDQKATCENTARAMADSDVFIKQRHIRNCFRADPTYGKGVSDALGLSLEDALFAEDPAHPDWDDR